MSLDELYYELRKIHQEEFPDLSFGQLYCSFFSWLDSPRVNVDYFYIEDEQIIMFLKAFVADKKLRASKPTGKK